MLGWPCGDSLKNLAQDAGDDDDPDDDADDADDDDADDAADADADDDDDDGCDDDDDDDGALHYLAFSSASGHLDTARRNARRVSIISSKRNRGKAWERPGKAGKGPGKGSGKGAADFFFHTIL